MRNGVAIIVVFAFLGGYMFAQYERDAAQDRRMEEWMSNTAATLEGMEYEVSRLMSERQKDTLYGK
jgi:uncharacterized membrane protein YkgB